MKSLIDLIRERIAELRMLEAKCENVDRRKGVTRARMHNERLLMGIIGENKKLPFKERKKLNV